MISWEDLTPLDTGRFDEIITDQMLDQYLTTTHCGQAVLDLLNSRSPRCVPTEILGHIAVRPLFQTFVHREIGPNVRVRQNYRFQRRVYVGDRIHAVGRLVEKYEANKRRFFVLEATFFNGDDQPVLFDSRTQMLLQKATVKELT